MISQRVRGRARPIRMTKNVERLYKEGKCRDCSVMVTRMDFAKILGKFTKVKIQYESNSTPKTKKTEDTSTNSTTRLQKNENGMVLIHRNAFNQHPAIESVNSKKLKNNKQPPPTASPRLASPRQSSNILKENNRLRKPAIVKDKNSNYNQQNQHLINSNLKQYGIIFINPNVNSNNDIRNKTTLQELLPDINKSILPTEEWAIDYFPKSDEPKEDKVYDRIAAELEDLMYNEKPTNNTEGKTEVAVSKVDDFPSIMDILNDSTSESIDKPNDQSSATACKSDLESCDVEAMLLGKNNTESKAAESISMDVDGADMASLIGGPLDAIRDPNNKSGENESKQVDSEKNSIAKLGSPSILDEALQKGIEEQLLMTNDSKVEDETSNKIKNVMSMDTDVSVKESKISCESDSVVPKTEVTHVIFKQTKDGKCCRCVTCPRNLKYSIELDGKAVEFIGAPKFISSLDDLEVLLQIVNETHLESLYVLH